MYAPSMWGMGNIDKNSEKQKIINNLLSDIYYSSNGNIPCLMLPKSLHERESRLHENPTEAPSV